MIWQEPVLLVLVVVSMLVFIGWLLTMPDPNGRLVPQRKPSNGKEAQAAGKADPLAGLMSERRAVRTKSHNEWLNMWYNALPMMEKSRLNNAWENESMDLYHAMSRMSGDLAEYSREHHRYLLHHVSIMVHAMTHGTTDKDTDGGSGNRTGHHVLVGDRTGAGRVGAGASRTGAGQAAEAGAVADPCASCACGRDDAC